MNSGTMASNASGAFPVSPCVAIHDMTSSNVALHFATRSASRGSIKLQREKSKVRILMIVMFVRLELRKAYCF